MTTRTIIGGALDARASALVDDLWDEFAARDPAYLAALPVALPDAAGWEQHIRLVGHAPELILPLVLAGIDRLRDRGLSVATGGDDPVGQVLAAALVDAAMASLGLLDLLPEPRDPRPLEDVIREEFDVVTLPSGQRAIAARRPGRSLVVIGALGVPVSTWGALLKDHNGPFRPIFVETRCGDLFGGGMASEAPLTAHADDVVAGLDALRIGRFDLLGWCNGGRIAIEVARRVPDRAASVVLLAATLRHGAGPLTRTCAYEDNLEKAFARIRARPAFAGPVAQTLGEFFNTKAWTTLSDPIARGNAFLGRPRADLGQDLGRPMATGPFLLAYAARTAADEGFDITDAIAGLHCPLAVLVGESDAIVSNAHTLATAGPVPAAAIRGAGHSVPDLQYRYLRHLLGRFFANPQQPDFSGSLRIADATSLEPPQWRWSPDLQQRGGTRHPLGRIFAHPAACQPHAPALADGDTALSYAALERGAIALAHLLVAAGVRRFDHAVVLSEKCAAVPMVTGAIWKADAVYVPIDPAMPVARLGAILNQVHPSSIHGSRAMLQRLREHDLIPADCPAFIFEDALAAADGPPPTPGMILPALDADEGRPAYVIFTSGSSGTPKGVIISHRSLLDYFSNHNQVLRFGPGSRVLSLAPFCFDVSIEDTILPLSLGAFVFQFRGLPVGPPIRRTLRRERITHLIAVSSLLALITGDGSDILPATLPDLLMVMTGAELCDPRLIDLWVLALPGVRVINAYGPTEATIVSHTFTVAVVEPGRAASYPIGKPLHGVTMLLLDGAGQPVTQPGIDGELLIGGSQVMIGYLNQPEETARACPTIDGQRYYRTGDICRFDERGRLEFVGRRDDQVKIAGRRIQLGEIRQAALAIPGVSQAAVGTVPVNGRPGIGLVAVLQHACGPDEATIRTALSTQLPAFMVPVAIGTTVEGRLTTSGKTDVRILLEALAQRAGPGAGRDSEVMTLADDASQEVV